jgi:hypothetical protein
MPEGQFINRAVAVPWWNWRWVTLPLTLVFYLGYSWLPYLLRYSTVASEPADIQQYLSHSYTELLSCVISSHITYVIDCEVVPQRLTHQYLIIPVAPASITYVLAQWTFFPLYVYVVLVLLHMRRRFWGWYLLPVVWLSPCWYRTFPVTSIRMESIAARVVSAKFFGLVELQLQRTLHTLMLCWLQGMVARSGMKELYWKEIESSSFRRIPTSHRITLVLADWIVHRWFYTWYFPFEQLRRPLWSQLSV